MRLKVKKAEAELMRDWFWNRTQGLSFYGRPLYLYATAVTLLHFILIFFLLKQN